MKEDNSRWGPRTISYQAMSGEKTILYIHGMGGGGDSRIPSILKGHIAGVTVRTYSFNPDIAAGQIDGNRYKHMVALVAAVLGMLDIVFERNDLQISLFGEHICDQVDIRSKRADNADAGNIPNMLYHVSDIDFVAVFLQLFYDTFRGLDPGFYMFYGCIVMYMLKLVIEDFNLCVDFL